MPLQPPWSAVESRGAPVIPPLSEPGNLHLVQGGKRKRSLRKSPRQIGHKYYRYCKEDAATQKVVRIRVISIVLISNVSMDTYLFEF